MAYDAEVMNWELSPPKFALLPGCVNGAGRLEMAVAVALVPIFQGARHVLGRSGRSAFFVVLSILSAISALAIAVAVSYGNQAIIKMISTDYHEASFFGTAFGLSLLASVVAVFTSVEHHWSKVEPLSALAMVLNGIGLVLTAPALTVAVFAVAFALLVILGFILSRRAFEGSCSLRCALVVMMTVAAAVMYVMATAELKPMAAKIAAWKSMAVLPDWFFNSRNVLSAVSLKSWKENPWIGSGLGSFPLDLRFMATAEDWKVVSPLQATPLSGWWLVLAERGVIGALIIAVTLGMLTWTYFARLIANRGSLRMRSEHVAGIIGVLSLVALAFFDCSYMRPELLILAGSLLAFAGGSFPAHSRHHVD